MLGGHWEKGVFEIPAFVPAQKAVEILTTARHRADLTSPLQSVTQSPSATSRVLLGQPPDRPQLLPTEQACKLSPTSFSCLW